ncbi:MAG: sensor histidine kinase, partial [Anaerolineae bacterium]|nr:sensor histidine kinase [Anaerolineae bacterium]
KATRIALIIEDDGRGLPVPVTSGIGLQSMRERSEELGGSFSIAAGDAGGTRVTVIIPIQQEWQA